MRDVPQPRLKDGDLLVRVHAAGLNAADRFLLRGEPYAVRPLAGGLRRPRAGFVVGRAVAGRVEQVRGDVHDFAPGDDVLAESPSAVGEFARVPARLAAPMPTGLSYAEAAALPVAGTTALQSVRGVRPGQRVLVTGAAGGVGSFAVQLATARGADVTAVCAGRNVAMMHALGIEHVIDYERATVADIAAFGQVFDMILDLAGNYPLAALRQALAPGGTLVLSVGTGGRWLGPARRILAGVITGGRRVRTFTARPNSADLTELASMVATGRIRPVIDRTYSFDEAASALDRIDQGRVDGKIIVKVAG
ncbi:NAD(P)-dependent alcohol dehydrogenase [Actinoplanes utahensis]|nr:NADPH:quinone reductase [Actinoplanes utahensis]